MKRSQPMSHLGKNNWTSITRTRGNFTGSFQGYLGECGAKSYRQAYRSFQCETTAVLQAILQISFPSIVQKSRYRLWSMIWS